MSKERVNVARVRKAQEAKALEREERALEALPASRRACAKSIVQLLREHKWSVRAPIVRGYERTPELETEVIRRSEARETVRAIAASLGLPEHVVSDIRRKHRFKPVRAGSTSAPERRTVLMDGRGNVVSKFCPACEKTLPAAEFKRNAANATGLQSECYLCQSKRRKARRAS